jgi:hypothetical protein
MSGAFTKEHYDKANSLGITIFKKPFKLSEINHWLDQLKKILPRKGNWQIGS